MKEQSYQDILRDIVMELKADIARYDQVISAPERLQQRADHATLDRLGNEAVLAKAAAEGVLLSIERKIGDMVRDHTDSAQGRRLPVLIFGQAVPSFSALPVASARTAMTLSTFRPSYVSPVNAHPSRMPTEAEARYTSKLADRVQKLDVDLRGKDDALTTKAFRFCIRLMASLTLETIEAAALTLSDFLDEATRAADVEAMQAIEPLSDALSKRFEKDDLVWVSFGGTCLWRSLQEFEDQLDSLRDYPPIGFDGDDSDDAYDAWKDGSE